MPRLAGLDGSAADPVAVASDGYGRPNRRHSSSSSAPPISSPAHASPNPHGVLHSEGCEGVGITASRSAPEASDVGQAS
eukprot:CAMPEP_0181212426 /NCGR_PEP_ID=MMETSP1096-20121128/24342_1 /TAXON_ID=156174 ORGANISM="Chrysochromulina ericina, Strain CCMP281" /NCGR_SAMPLE_ID=MMETSP1096 /ASSEMBLY_ACC=CAM_ASM_000453 /LENGTH=78 /DNA_ID=CAMNT_0023303951 /DNA_START=177 /DNA_END=413 /DNA_ORIENTATION=+